MWLSVINKKNFLLHLILHMKWTIFHARGVAWILTLSAWPQNGN